MLLKIIGVQYFPLRPQVMKILHGGLIITYLKNFIFDDDCIACQKHGKHGDKKILIDSVLCLSINGLWIAFHWRRTWLPPQHSFFAHVKIGMCESNVYSSINQWLLSIYTIYTFYIYAFFCPKISIDWCCGWHFN